MPKKQTNYDNSSCDSNISNNCNHNRSPVKRSNARVGNVTLRKRTKSENGILSGESSSQEFNSAHLEQCLIVAEQEALKMHHNKMHHYNAEKDSGDQEEKKIVTALYEYTPSQEDELELQPGDKVRVLSQDCRDSGTEGWWVGLRDSRIGVFPHNFVDSSESACSLIKGESDRLHPEVKPRTPSENRTFQLVADQNQEQHTERDQDLDSQTDFLQASRSSTGFAISGSTGVRTIPPNEIEKLEILGFGSFGMVYHGRWNNQDVAMKTFSWHANEVHIYQEAGHLSCLVHRHIVRLFGVSSLAGQKSNGGGGVQQLALIMEYARGGALNQLLHPASTTASVPLMLSPRTLLRMSQQIAAGMRYLHCQAHICHRDLKSSNVLIKEAIPENATDEEISRCTLLITDFGMARRTADLVSQQSKLGTLAYAAPEVCKQQGGFTVKSDVWSYGVLLWELLTKEIPYRDVEQPHLLYKIAFKNHKLYIPEGIPSILVNLLKSCWAEDKEKRPDFNRIVRSLQSASSYKFMEIAACEFHELQKSWREEIRWAEQRVEERDDDIDRDATAATAAASDSEEKWRKLQDELEKAHNELQRREEAMQQREAACDRAMGTVMLFTVLAGAIPQQPQQQPQPPPRRRPFVGRLKFWWSTNANHSTVASAGGCEGSLPSGSNTTGNSAASPATPYSTNNTLGDDPFPEELNFQQQLQQQHHSLQKSGNPNISAPSNLQHVVHISKDGLNFASPALNFFPESMKVHTWDAKSGRGGLSFRDRLRSSEEQQQQQHKQPHGQQQGSAQDEDGSLHTDTAESGVDSPSPCGVETPGSSCTRAGTATKTTTGNGASPPESSLCASAPNLRKVSLGNLPVYGFSSFRRPLYCDTNLDEDSDHRKRIPCDRCIWKNKARCATIGAPTSSSMSSARPPAIQAWSCIPSEPPRGGLSGCRAAEATAQKRNTSSSSGSAATSAMESGGGKRRSSRTSRSSQCRWRKVDHALWSVMRMLSAVVLPDRGSDEDNNCDNEDQHPSAAHVRQSYSPTLSLDVTPCTSAATTTAAAIDFGCGSQFSLSEANQPTPGPIPSGPSDSQSLSSPGLTRAVKPSHLKSRGDNGNGSRRPPSSSRQRNHSWWRGSSAPPKQRITTISPPIMHPPKSAQATPAVISNCFNCVNTSSGSNYFASWLPPATGAVSDPSPGNNNVTIVDLKLESQSFDTASSSCNSCDQRV